MSCATSINDGSSISIDLVDSFPQCADEKSEELIARKWAGALIMTLNLGTTWPTETEFDSLSFPSSLTEKRVEVALSLSVV